MEIAPVDLHKIRDALRGAVTFHKRRDEMNAALHKADEVRYSPLTATLMSEHERADRLLEEALKPVQLRDS